MKRLIAIWIPFIALSTILLCACDKDDYEPYYTYDSSIYVDSDEVFMSELILFVKPYVMEGDTRKYILTESIYDLNIKINNFWEGHFESYSFDIRSNMEDRNEHFYLSNEAIPYPFVIEIATVPDNLITAGDYSGLLNNYWNLQPGAYVCQIQSFRIKTIAGEEIKVNTPSLIVPLEVTKGVASVNLGTFDVEIK